MADSSLNSAAGRRVMLIDSDDSYLRVLYGMLTQCGCCVTGCRKVGKALSVLRERNGDYDLILSSAHLPDVEDFKLVYTIRFKLKIPVILMSYDEEPNFSVSGMIARGSCGYLRKPVDIDTLRNIWSCDYLQSWRFKKRALGVTPKKVDIQRSADPVHEGETSNGTAGENRELEILEQGRNLESKDSTEWTEEVQRLFQEAVGKLGLERATAKSIRRAMGVEGLTHRQVTKQWRLYRKQNKSLASGDNLDERVSSCPDPKDHHDPERPSRTHGETSKGSKGEGGLKRNSGGLECQEVKTKKRVRVPWTPELYESFDKAVKELGGIGNAKARAIFGKMILHHEDLSIHSINYHYALYRKQHALKEDCEKEELTGFQLELNTVLVVWFVLLRPLDLTSTRF
ncbi:hypothetical protein R1sor_000822 [Riccia sorocarpa]|uniref:Response regulatory domain-containing protein n=1 Tax=Riccia sorocarpa TaxID=122646 RepID=A0ABD3GU66_9MARC